MKNKSATPINAPELRRQAESKLTERKKKEAVTPEMKADTQRLVHELEVHQIELEMQNEELVQSRAEVEALLRQYIDLYDFAPVGYFTLARDGAIGQANLAGANLLGVERGALINRRFGVFVPAESRTTLNAFLERVFRSQQKETCEVALQKDGPAPLWAHIEAIITNTSRGEGEVCNAAISDITERKQAEATLQEVTNERETLVRRLQYALDNVKTLQGLIPICSNCKKIRDDKGFWNQVEGYIMKHSDASFTHGVCPECERKLYGDIDHTTIEKLNEEK
jgi:PAS domain S-box-containing protein